MVVLMLRIVWTVYSLSSSRSHSGFGIGDKLVTRV